MCPQLLLSPRRITHPRVTFSFPQEHRHSHLTAPYLSTPTRSITVHSPMIWPVMSIPGAPLLIRKILKASCGPVNRNLHYEQTCKSRSLDRRASDAGHREVERPENHMNAALVAAWLICGQHSNIVAPTGYDVGYERCVKVRDEYENYRSADDRSAYEKQVQDDQAKIDEALAGLGKR
jgi:hypothetical protein